MQLLAALGCGATVLIDHAKANHGAHFYHGAMAAKVSGMRPRTPPAPPTARAAAGALRLRNSALLLVGLAGSLSVANLGCDAASGEQSTEVPGYVDASSPDMRRVPQALRDEDLEGARARGLELWRMQRAQALTDAALERYGGARPPRTLGIATIDPVGNSGEVAYFAWDAASLEDGRAEAGEARRWLTVSVALDPDEALEPVEITTAPTEGQRRALDAMARALAAAQAEYPGGDWRLFVFREVAPPSPGKKKAKKVRGQTRVYLMGVSADSPDLELTVLDGQGKKGAPELGLIRMHVAAGAKGSSEIATPVTPPGPPSLARAYARAAALGAPVELVDATGMRYPIEAPR
ncbi:hypothetical protein PPSIR1_25156 [Plesiocystis pacifica SIR-1]|uniref:Uncharacterized protein n=2 Tax=Plesiocystis pacifica TaxID=191768 RepID=A6GDX9_9BACT|nr:hypothetical protein PPSIR1_25156 [Plesiocystis pacifica SIR-1]